MHRILVLAILISPFCSVQRCEAQIEVSGTITTSEGQSIPGANVFIEGTYTGTSTDIDGYFSIDVPAGDSVVLRVSVIGFEGYRERIALTDGPLFRAISLSEISNRLGEVVISAGVFEAGTATESQVLQPLDIVTTAGVTADIPGALNTLPGTQIVGETGRLFVRGGDSYETTTFIDGMAVPEAYDIRSPNTPTRSRFSPFMFSGTSFSTGGYSAEYGQGLSSALILNTKEVATETRTDVSLISVGLEAAHTQNLGEGSVAAKLGYYNLDPYFNIIRQDFDWINPPTSMDGNVAFRQKVGKDGMLKTYGKFNNGGMTFERDPYTSTIGKVRTEMNNDYRYVNTSFRDVLSEKWSLRTGLSHTRSADDIKLDQDQVLENTYGWHGKFAAIYAPNERILVRMGSEWLRRSHTQDFYVKATDFRNVFSFKEDILSSFVEVDWHLSGTIMARIGGRTEYNMLTGKMSIDPRFSMAWKTGAISQVSLAMGRFRQSAPQELLRVASGLVAEKSNHFIVNYQLSENNRTFRIEGYWKTYEDLVTYNSNSPFDPQSYGNAGDGYARGIDLFYRDGKTFENVDFWVSYSLLDSERNYRDFPVAAAPTFTSKHNVSIVYKQFIPDLKTQVGLTYFMASGRPYNDPNSRVFNGRRTPVFHDLSMNLSYLPRPNLIVHASITNVLNRENIFGYEFRSEADEMGVYQGRAITLPARRFLFLGVFITLTKSGTISQLPNL